MSEQLKQLQELAAQLHEVNQQLAEAARPLERLSEMNFEQRKHLGSEIRAALARWESVTQKINEVLGQSGGRAGEQS